MESKKITFTVGNLNSGAVYAQDIRLQIPSAKAVSINTATSGNVNLDRMGISNNGSNVYGQDTIYRKPGNMRMVNKTGADFEFNLISDDTELINYSGYPQNYTRLKVYNNETFTMTAPRSTYILGYTSGTVSSNLDIYFWGYV